MLIFCPKCGYRSEIDDAKVPEWAKAFKCPKCGQSISLKREPEIEFLSHAPDHDFTFETAEQPVAPPEISGDTDIPWESRQGGFFRYFFSTMGMVLFKPSRFFDAMRPVGGYKRPMAFVVFLAYLTTVLSESVSWGLQHWLAEFIGGIQGPLARDFVEKLLGIKMYHEIVIAFLFVGPWLAPLFLFVLAYLVHVFLPPDKERVRQFGSTYRVLAYVSAANIFGVIPVVGWIVTLIWGIKIAVIGLSRVYQISTGRLFWNVVGAYIVYTLVLFFIF